MESKHSEEPWEIIYEHRKAKGIRNAGGYLCFLKYISKWTGQQERYEKELAEAEANAKLFNAAPNLLKACKAAEAEIALLHRMDKNWGACPQATGEGDCEVCKLLTLIEAAIAKATD